MSRSLQVIRAISFLLALGSCYEDDSTGPPNGQPLTSIELTDAPFPYDSVARVDIHVVRIDFSPSLDTSSLNTDWVTVAQPNRTYNLIELTGGLTDTLGLTTVPEGVYRSVRMVLDTDQSSITAKDGQPMPVAWQSSAGRPTLYAYVENAIEVGAGGTDVVIDFDVGRSFLCDEPCSSFVFSPVFRAVARNTTGTVSGRVVGDTLVPSPTPIQDVSITVYRGDIAAPSGTWFVVATARTDDQGYFRIAYLTPGTYILRADAPRGSPYGPGVRSGVVVAAGQETQNQGINLPAGSSGRLEVTPAVSAIAAGDSVVLTAQAYAANGAPYPNAAVLWSIVNDTSLASIIPLGGQSALFKAKAPGTVSLWVYSAGVSTVLTIVVTSGPPPPTATVATVTVTAFDQSVARGDTLGLTATARDSAGQIVPGRSFAWFSSDSLVARIIYTGGTGNSYAVVRGGVPGTATIQASADGKTGSATITVR
jgi:hypothetical protein